MRCGMERNNRDEDIMMRGTKQEMPGFRFRLLRPEKKRELWNPDFELLFLLRGRGRVSYEDGEVHNLPMGSIFAINRFQICDLDLDEDGLALSLCVSAETIASFHIKLLKCEGTGNLRSPRRSRLLPADLPVRTAEAGCR